MRIAADASITKTRRMVLAAIAVMGFGLLQGARFIDVNSGPYSAHSLALFGLFVDGATLLTIAVLSYFGKIDDNRKLYCAGAISCALYLALSLLNLGDATIHQAFAGLTWSLNILCWMEIFTNYKPRFALIMIALAYAVNVAVKPLLGALGLPVEGALAAFMAISIVLLGICIRYDKAIAYDTLANEQAFSDASCHETTTLSEAFSRARRAVACAFAFSFVCGFVIEADLLATNMEYAQSNETALICLVAAILMVCALLVFFDSKSEYRLHVPHSRRLDCNGVVHAIYGIARSFGIGQYHDGYFDFVLRIALAHARERSPRKEAPRIFPARPCPGSRTFVGYGGSGMRRLGHRRQSHRSERSKCRKPLGACNCGFNHILRLFALFLKTLTGRLRRNRPR